MSRRNCALAIGVALASVLACKGTPRSDAMIATEVREDLREADDLRADAITVQAKNGEVTLEGVVPSEDARQRAEQIADDVNGVTRVANRLQVASGSSPAPMRPTPPVSAPPPPPPGSTSGEPMNPTSPPPSAP